MTDRSNDNLILEHGSTEAFEGDDARTARIQEVIDAGREEELPEQDYQYAIQHGLIEG